MSHETFLVRAQYRRVLEYEDVVTHREKGRRGVIGSGEKARSGEIGLGGNVERLKVWTGQVRHCTSLQ